MKTTYDSENDMLYLRFLKEPIVESEEVEKGVIIDYGTRGEIVAIEISELSNRPIDLTVSRSHGLTKLQNTDIPKS